MFNNYEEFSEMSSRHSPKKVSRSVTSESLDLAKEIFDGKRNISTLEPTEVKICLQGLQAIRHRSIIENNKKKMQKCDSLILELNSLEKASIKDSSSIKSSGSNSINFRCGYVRSTWTKFNFTDGLATVSVLYYFGSSS